MSSRYHNVCGRWTAPISPSSPDSAIYQFPIGSPSSAPGDFFDRHNSAPILQSTPRDGPFLEPITPINHLTPVFEVGDATLIAAADEIEDAEEVRAALEAFYFDEYHQRYPQLPVPANSPLPICTTPLPERRRAVKRKLDF